MRCEDTGKVGNERKGMGDQVSTRTYARTHKRAHTHTHTSWLGVLMQIEDVARNVDKVWAARVFEKGGQKADWSLWGDLQVSCVRTS